MLLYHIVCPAKYRKVVLSDEVDQVLKDICVDISKRYEMHFVEIGTDEDHVHFMIQGVPTMTVEKIVRTIKSITARFVFQHYPQLKKELWGGNFWTSGYYANTVGQYGNMDIIKKYVENQGKEYKQVHIEQLKLW